MVGNKNLTSYGLWEPLGEEGYAMEAREGMTCKYFSEPLDFIIFTFVTWELPVGSNINEI